MMTRDFFHSPTNQGVPARQNPVWSGYGGTEDMTRQMVGEPALRQIYKRGARRMPCCPGCGLEVGPCEEHIDITIGENFLEQFLLAGLTVTYRAHAICDEVPREELFRRTMTYIVSMNAR